MKEKPFISIIIPAYNAETTLKRCVRSVLIQDYEEYEIIIVDDGSKDETSAICDWYEKKYKAVQDTEQTVFRKHIRTVYYPSNDDKKSPDCQAVESTSHT